MGATWYYLYILVHIIILYIDNNFLDSLMLDWHDPLMLDHHNMTSMMPISTLKKAAHCIRSILYPPEKYRNRKPNSIFRTLWNLYIIYTCIDIRGTIYVYIYIYIFCTCTLCIYIYTCICSMWTCINESNPLCHSPLSRLQPQKEPIWHLEALPAPAANLCPSRCIFKITNLQDA